jgi:hypothetical protein
MSNTPPKRAGRAAAKSSQPHPAIQDRHDTERGCGYRDPGSAYFISDGPGRSCGLLPFELKVCPCCGGGIKFSRGYRWIDLKQLIKAEFCTHHGDKDPDTSCDTCPLNPMNMKIDGKVLLLWVGGKTPQKGSKGYPTPESFVREAQAQGVSRKLKGNQIPKGFKTGETWIALSHMTAIKNPEGQPQPPAAVMADDQEREYKAKLKAYREHVAGVFYLFQPTRLEWVLTPEQERDYDFVQDLVDRGFTPVRVFDEDGVTVASGNSRKAKLEAKRKAEKDAAMIAKQAAREAAEKQQFKIDFNKPAKPGRRVVVAKKTAGKKAKAKYPAKKPGGKANASKAKGKK